MTPGVNQYRDRLRLASEHRALLLRRIEAGFQPSSLRQLAKRIRRELGQPIVDTAPITDPHGGGDD